MSEEKLHNREYDVKRVDGEATNSNDPVKGNYNKIKLKITSYAVTMEVQEAFMQEEIEENKNKLQELEEKVSAANNTEVESIEDDIYFLKQEIRSLEEDYKDFSVAHQRFLALAKKALKLPEENLKELAETGSTKLDNEKGEKEIIDLEDLKEAKEDAQNAITDEKGFDIFSSVDSNLIKEEVEKMMNNKITSTKTYGDTVVRNIDADNFDDTVSEIAEDVKNEINEIKDNEVTTDHMKDLFSSQEKNDVNEDSHTIDFDVSPAEAKIGEWVNEQTPDDNKSFTGFDNDNSIEEFIKDLENKNERLKAHGEELNSQLSGVKEEQIKATEKKEAAERGREEAKRRKEEAKKQVELITSYKPKMDALRKANAEQEKINSDKEEELRKENETLATINSETTAIETETAIYDEETSKALEELKRLRAEFAGTEYNDSSNSTTINDEIGRKKM